jgi:hypothetical protein
VRKADNLQPSCADVTKSGGLNLLEPCGPAQACNGTAFLSKKNKIFDMFMRNKVLLFVIDAENKTSAKCVRSWKIQ